MRKIDVVLTAACLGLSVLSGPVEGREYSQVITVNDYSYEIEVGGWRDPVNETIIIENLGDTPLVNPRLTVDGKYDWFDIETMAREATRGCTTDEERALALWDFVRRNFQHLDSPGDRECHNPAVSLNVYGYANCAYHASAFVALCRSIGIPARVWEVWKHTVSEAFYNNAWHMLDSDIGLYYLAGDNRTIASIEQLWADQKASEGVPEKANLTAFSGRNKAVRAVYTDVEGGNPHVSQDGIYQRGYRYFHGADECYIQTGYDRFTYEPHSMAMTLRPGETLIRNWKGGKKYYDYERHDQNLAGGNQWAKPMRYGDGQLIWKPDLNSKLAPSFFNQNQAPCFAVLDGQQPAVHVRHKQGGIYDMPERAILDMETPYVILGGKIKARLYRGAATRWDGMSFTVSSRTGPVSQTVWRAPKDSSGSLQAEVDLDKVLFPSGERGRHDYSVEFNFMANEKNDPPTQSGLESVELTADIQCSSYSLPALALGHNVIRYRDETPGPHQVKITHIWRERTNTHPPAVPQKALYPADGATVKDLAPNFRWSTALDPDKGDKVENHRLIISFDPQCRWPVATALLKETASGKPEWKLDPGWLNPDTMYYWRVQAGDNNGAWSGWSQVFSFRTAPAR